MICEVKNNGKILNIKHCTDLNNKRDLFLSMSKDKLNIWNLNNMNCLLKITEIELFNSCIFNENGNIRIIYSCYFSSKYCIKIIDLNGNILNIINDLDDWSYSINIYYDFQLTKFFIIVGFYGFINSYNYSDTKKYQCYKCGGESVGKYHISICRNYNKVMLLDFNNIARNEFIMIFDFHTGLIINSIDTKEVLFGTCLFNNNYVMISTDKEIQFIDINSGESIESIKFIETKNLPLYYMKEFKYPNQSKDYYFLCQCHSGKILEVIISQKF